MLSPSRSLLLCAAGAVLLLFACDTAGDDPPVGPPSITVPAQANIFAAGRSQVPDLRGGGGVLPVLIEVPDTAKSITFPDVEGIISANTELFDDNGPDGGARDSTAIDAYEGISGIVHDNTFLFLVGVFLTDDEPMPPAPERLNVTSAESQVTFPPPQIGQVFYIGDGSSASGVLQRLAIPEEATRLFLGFADTAVEQGPPGFYDDNEGEITLTHEFSSTE